MKPDIRRFDIPEYLHFQGIQSLAFDDKGIVYLSSPDQLFVFNGSSWEYVSTSGKTLVASVKGDRVYVSDENIFGILTTDSSSHYRIVPENDLIERSGQGPAEIRQMIPNGGQLFLNIGGRISTLKNNRLVQIPVSGKNPRLLNTGRKVLILTDQGIEYPGNQDRIFLFNDDLTATGEVIVRDHPEGYLLYNRKEGRFLILSEDLHALDGWDTTTLRGEYTNFIYNEHGYYYFLSDDLTLLVSNIHGQVLTRLAKTPFSKVQNNSFFVSSPSDQIWLVQNHTIHVLDFPSSYSELNTANVNGDIRDVNIFEGALFVATNQGLYSCRDSCKVLLPQAVSRLVPNRNTLYVLSEGKVCRIRHEGFEKIPDISCRDIFQEGTGGNLIIAGDSGFTILDSLGMIIRSRSFAERINPLLFIAGGERLYYLSGNSLLVFNPFTGEIQRKTFADLKSNRKISQLFWWRGQVHFLSGNKILSYSTNGLPLSEIIPRGPVSGQIVHATVLDDNRLVLTERNEWNETELEVYDVLKDTLYHLPVPVRTSPYSMRISIVNDSSLILTANNRLFCISTNPPGQKAYYPVITSIIAGNDTLFNGSSFSLAGSGVRTRMDHIPYSENDLRIILSTTDFVPGLKKHQYLLQRNGGKWSEWQLGNILRLDDLLEGDYHLQIRFLNSRGNLSGLTHLDFSVKPPPYRAWYAWLAYFLLGFTLVFIIYKSLRFRLHRNAAADIDNSQKELQHAIKDNGERKVYEFISTVDGDAQVKRTKWDKYEMATVLFSDIQGFTKIAEQMNPERLIDELDKFFFHFDSVVEKYNIEKIKTIGDAYMAAGGIPRKNSTNPIEVVLAALEMQQYMKQLKKDTIDIWDLRIGIHSGPVIAGTIGQKKRSYDIWGDTVNTASRMESSGEAGKVNISGITYSLIRDYFLCEYRGKLPVKYKGNIDMYFVKGLRPELSINLGGIPNRKFFVRLQLLRLNDLEEYVFDRLETELPKNLYFHNVEYARQIYSHAGLLCKAEDLDSEETLMILTACLILPLGYISSYENPEKQAASIARDILTNFFYSEKQINLISNLILSAKWPPSPRNLLEEVMADARSEYLGRVDYVKLYKLLFLEHNEFMEPLEIREWKEQQIRILTGHRFFTAGANRLREITAEEQIRKIRETNL